jgi:nicotinic acetylcholine receptor
LYNRFSGLVGSLGVGLSSMGGYNGLPSIMSMDESLSEHGKKKYPFELEKAIHNVMFIQHHMQRQDEFNAVSIQMSNVEKSLDNFLTFFLSYKMENGNWNIVWRKNKCLFQ